MLSKKSKNNPVLMEARKILLSQYDVGEDGRYVVAEKRKLSTMGTADGENRIRAFGITNINYEYKTSSSNNTQAVYKAVKSMQSIGRGIDMKSLEFSAACMVKTYIFYPVVLVFFENDEEELELSAFTARCVTARLAVSFAVKNFDKASRGLLERLDKNGNVVGSPEARKEKKSLAEKMRSWKPSLKHKKKVYEGEPEEEEDEYAKFKD